MTAIAYRDGVLAADSGVFCNYLRAGETTKAIRGPCGYLAAAAGDQEKCQQFLRWVADGASGRAPAWPITEGAEFRGIVVSPAGQVAIYGMAGDHYLFSGEFYAEGAASEFLTGALAAGATAEAAVILAIKYHIYAGGPVVVLELEVAAGEELEIEEAEDEPGRAETVRERLGLE